MSSKSELVEELGRVAKGHYLETGDEDETLAAIDEVRERIRTISGDGA